jgi:AmiR/NasT family two-component response regulator
MGIEVFKVGIAVGFMQKVTFSGEAAREAAAVDSILLVTDNTLTIATVGNALRSTGFEVLEALDGSDGIQLAQQLTERFFVPFVYLAPDEEAVITAAVSAGAMACLVRPIEPAQIVPLVRAALRRSQELRALQSQTERLTAAVQTGKQIGIATGLIMANLRLDQQEAFERLRRQARTRRARLEDLAAELLRAADETGGFYRSLEAADTPRRRTAEDVAIVPKERLSG